MSQIRVNNITNKTGIAGPSVAGIASVNSNSHFVVPTGRTGQRYADNGENIVRDGLVLYLDAKYSYPGATGTNPDVYTWYDMSGNENHGELKNGVGYNTANGGSLVFDGVDDYVDCGTGLSSSSLTISLWVKFNSLSNQVLITKGNWDTNAASYTIAYYNNEIRTDTFESDSTYGTTKYSFTPTLNIWYNLTFVSNANNSTYTEYINASNITLTISNVYRTPRSGSYSVNIGRNTNGNYPFNGNIAKVSVYNRALSASEIQQNFNATRSRYGI